MRKSVGIALLSLMISAAGAATVYAAGWQQGAGGWWYEYEDGSYAKSGIRQIGDQQYAFDQNGYMLQGWQYIGFKWYYFEPEGGAMAMGWKQVGDKWYYLDPNDNGAMYTYWLDIGKDRYDLDENGVLQTGLFYLSDSTSGSKYAYQADANGVLIRNKTVELGDRTVRYDSNGIMMYKSEATKLKAKIDGSDPWQYVLSEKELKEESTDNTISEAVDDLKSDLSDEYREKIRGLSRGTTKDRKVASWESKVRKKLGDYLVDSWEIEEFIYDVEHGTYY